MFDFIALAAVLLGGYPIYREAWKRFANGA